MQEPEVAATAKCKETLWNCCFQPRIRSYRGRLDSIRVELRKRHARAKSAQLAYSRERTPEALSAAREEVRERERVRNQHAYTYKIFTRILGDYIAYFRDLSERVRKRRRVLLKEASSPATVEGSEEGEGRQSSQPSASASASHLRDVWHLCLIKLGCLERYLANYETPAPPVERPLPPEKQRDAHVMDDDDGGNNGDGGGGEESGPNRGPGPLTADERLIMGQLLQQHRLRAGRITAAADRAREYFAVA